MLSYSFQTDVREDFTVFKRVFETIQGELSIYYLKNLARTLRIQLNSSLCIFQIQQYTWHINIIKANNDLKFFNEYTTEQVHLCPQKEEYTSHLEI